MYGEREVVVGEALVRCTFVEQFAAFRGRGAAYGYCVSSCGACQEVRLEAFRYVLGERSLNAFCAPGAVYRPRVWVVVRASLGESLPIPSGVQRQSWALVG